MSIVASAFAAADVIPVAENAEKQQPAELLEEESPAWFEAEVDLDLFSAYIWRNAVVNDELVFQPCVSLDFARLEPFWIGGYVWQNWNMTGAQDADRPRAMNETDFNVYIGATLWESEDEEYSFDLELGNDFFT